MEIIIQPTPEQCAQTGANFIETLVRKKPNAVLGLATGSTPLGLYKELIRRHKEEGLDFSKITTFNLDEYIGLSPSHPASYHYFMQENLFKHINVSPMWIHIPDGLVQNIPAYCESYEEAIIDTGGIDLQILGIGHDGHIGFNEPSSSLRSRTRTKMLTEETIHANQRFFDSADEVPRHVITMGVGTIMDARICVLLAFGEEKADAVAAMAEGPMTAMCPASALQMHRRVSVIVDEAAASKLKRIDYYRYVQQNKLPFQKVSTFQVP